MEDLAALRARTPSSPAFPQWIRFLAGPDFGRTCRSY